MELTPNQQNKVEQIIRWQQQMSECKVMIGHYVRELGYEGVNAWEEIDKLRKE